MDFDFLRGKLLILQIDINVLLVLFFYDINSSFSSLAMVHRTNSNAVHVAVRETRS